MFAQWTAAAAGKIHIYCIAKKTACEQPRDYARVCQHGTKRTSRTAWRRRSLSAPGATIVSGVAPLRQEAALESQKNYLLNYGGMTGNIGGTPTLEWQKYQSDNAYNDKLLNQNQQALDYDQQMARKQQVIELWKQYGMLTPEMAQALGYNIPSGAQTVGYRGMYL